MSGISGDRVTRWIDVGYPKDRDRAEEQLNELTASSDADEEENSVEADEVTVDS